MLGSGGAWAGGCPPWHLGVVVLAGRQCNCEQVIGWFPLGNALCSKLSSKFLSFFVLSFLDPSSRTLEGEEVGVIQSNEHDLFQSRIKCIFTFVLLVLENGTCCT